MRNFIKILLVLGILVCSIANGLLLTGFGMPENFVFTAVSTLTLVGILYYHRRFSKDWKMPLDGWDDGDQVAICFFMLIISAAILVLAVMILLISDFKDPEHVKVLSATVVASASAAISYLVASVDESNYARISV